MGIGNLLTPEALKRLVVSNEWRINIIDTCPNEATMSIHEHSEYRDGTTSRDIQHQPMG